MCFGNEIVFLSSRKEKKIISQPTICSLFLIGLVRGNKNDLMVSQNIKVLSQILYVREVINLNYYLSHVMRKPVLPFANNKGADQPAHPCSLISASIVRCLGSVILLPVFAIAEISRL